jgi:hypothetical protein
MMQWPQSARIGLGADFAPSFWDEPDGLASIIAFGCSRVYVRASRFIMEEAPWTVNCDMRCQHAAGQALAAQAFDALDRLRRRRLTQPMRPRAAIL